MRRRSLLVSIALAVALGGCGSGDESFTADSGATTADADRTAGGAPVLGEGLTAEEAIDSDVEDLLLVTGYLSSRTAMPSSATVSWSRTRPNAATHRS
jgi:hypothetical protein